MPDLKWNTGSSGQMMIRDTGTYVEFWVTANNGTTFNHALPWRYGANGSTTAWKSYDYRAGAYWEKLGQVLVTYDQTVTFYLGDTGTSGLGGPTTHTMAINRTSAPPKPPVWKIEQVEHNRIQGDVDGYGNGGLTIDQIQVRYDESSTAASPLYKIDENDDGWMWIEGLTKGTTYYFWVRTHNSKGWSPWSDRTQATTDKEPNPPTAPAIQSTTMTSITLSVVWGLSNGADIVETQLGYGTSSAAPQVFQTFPVNSKVITVPELSPGIRYYFWARTRNAVGWSAWSARSDNAGSVFAGGWYFFLDAAGNIVPKKAIVYVNDGGIWRPTKPMVKIAGMWKETS